MADWTLVVAVAALIVSLVAAVFTGWQASLSKTMSDTAIDTLALEKQRYLADEERKEAERPKFDFQAINAIVPFNVTINTPAHPLIAEIWVIVAKVHNSGIKTAGNARPYFYYPSSDPSTSKGGTRVAWTTESLQEEHTFDSDHNLSNSDQVSDFLRRNFFTNRQQDVQGGDVVNVLLAFMVKGSNSICVPTTFKNSYPIPYTFADISLAIGMNDYRGSLMKLKDFHVYDWNKFGVRVDDGAAASASGTEPSASTPGPSP